MRKRLYGPWIYPALRLMAKARGIRGTRLDPFGYLADRKLERQLIVDYVALVEELAASLNRDNLALAARIAALPMGIKGYGYVKDRNLERVQGEQAKLLAQYRGPAALQRAA